MKANPIALLAVLVLATAALLPAADKITWKPITDAVLRIDDRAPKQWNLYRAGKKDDPLLLQLGTRALAIYVHNEQVYELNSSKLEHKGANLFWREEDRPEKPLATSAWSTRDVGSAERIRVTLTQEARTLDIQIPQIIDPF